MTKYSIAALIMISFLLMGSINGTAPNNLISNPSTTGAGGTNQIFPHSLSITESTDLITYQSPKKYEVTYSVTISNDNFIPSDVKVYLPIPSEWDAQKELKIVSLTPAPTKQGSEKTNGNSMAYWDLKGEPKKGSQSILSEVFQFTAYETVTHIDATQIQPYIKTSADYKRNTKPEKYIESNDKTIVKLADTVAAGETNPYLQAKKYYEYVIKNTRYQILGKGLNGAKALLTSGVGECGDYSALFIALCRSKGIPARPVVGYWAISGNNQTHVWAEFFLEGIGWIPVDATIGQQSTEKHDYYFGNMDNQRVILSKNFNSPLNPSGPGGFNASILQVPLWWYWGSGSGIRMDRDWQVRSVS